MGEGCKARVLSQIINFTQIRSSLPGNFIQLPTLEQTKAVLGLVLDRQWPGQGRFYLDRMWGDVAPAAASKASAKRSPKHNTGVEKDALGRWALTLACGMLDISPWETEGLPVAWAM